RADAGEEENQQPDAPDRDAGPTRILLAGTGGPHMQSKTGSGQEIVRKGGEGRHQKKRDRDADHRASGEPEEGGRDTPDALVRVGEDETLQHAQHPESQDEGIDFKPAVEEAVDQHHGRADQNAEGNRGEGKVRLSAHEGAGQHRDQTYELADRKVNETSSDDEGL